MLLGAASRSGSEIHLFRNPLLLFLCYGKVCSLARSSFILQFVHTLGETRYSIFCPLQPESNCLTLTLPSFTLLIRVSVLRRMALRVVFSCATETSERGVSPAQVDVARTIGVVDAGGVIGERSSIIRSSHFLDTLLQRAT